MRVEELGIAGARLIHASRHDDERGSFTRVVDLKALSDLELAVDVRQVSYAVNTQAGTLRGMHYQVGENSETKVIWCTSGRVWDVLVDVRTDSATYGDHVAVELSGHAPTAVLVGPGIAHGYQTLEPNTTLAYLIDAPFDPAGARTLLWNDPTVAIAWPLPCGPISKRDAEASPWPPPS